LLHVGALGLAEREAQALTGAADPIERADALRVLALTDLAGRPADLADPAVHHQAGAALAVLHGLPMTRHDPLSVADALRARLVRWIDEADGVLDDATVDRVAEKFADPALFAGCRRAWCHRDFSPRNWVEDGGVFGLLDFEHCGPDLPLFDLVKLADDAWRRFPTTRDALFVGYGRRLSAEDAERLERLMWLHALSTTAWASTHGDAEYERHGRALLSALHAGWAPAG
ncbi:MAG: aminoglycoside phosphotransferase family protein, partial [Myxococcota bacterium]